MRGWIQLCCVICFVVFYHATAQASDPAAPDLTVQPWTDSTFQLSEQEKRLALRYHTIRPSGLFLYSTGSVPLDAQTREAAFLHSGRLPAFAVRFQLGYDSRAERLKALARLLDDLETLSQPPDSQPLRAYLNTPVDTETDLKLCQIATQARQPSTGDECSDLDAWRARYTCTFYGYPNQSDALSCVVRGPHGDIGSRCHLPRPSTPGDLQPADVCDALEKYLAWKAHRYDAERSLYDLMQEYDTDLIREVRRIQGKSAIQLSRNRQKEFSEIAADPNLLKKLREKLDRHLKFNRSAFGFVGYDGSEKSTQWAVSGDFATHVDRQSIYQNDLTNKVDVTVYGVQFGAMAGLFLRSATTLILRAGWDGGVKMSPTTVERCERLPSQDPVVSGRSCDASALYLKGDLPGFSHSGYLRFAGLQLFPQLRRDHIVPGVELRLGLEGLGNDLRVNARLAGILTPVIGSAAVRGGIALDITYDPRATQDSDAWMLVPMAFLGATIDQYMGR